MKDSRSRRLAVRSAFYTRHPELFERLIEMERRAAQAAAHRRRQMRLPFDLADDVSIKKIAKISLR